VTAVHELTLPETIAGCLQWARSRLSAVSASATLDAELMLGEVLRVSRTHLRAWPERAVVVEAAEQFRVLVERRARGEPVAYLLGRQEFYGLELHVDRTTLIPRPETELVVDFVLAAVADIHAPRILDVGCGSGAIALAVADGRPDALVDAVERDPGAAAVAGANAARLALRNVTVYRGSWFEPVASRRYDVVAANPPYVAESERAVTSPETAFEPELALFAADAGLAALREITAGAVARLHAGGWLVLEHGYAQGRAVRGTMTAAGFVAVATQRDLANHERLTVGRLGRADGRRQDPTS